MGMMLFMVALGALVLWGVFIFNRLVSLKNRVKNAFSQIDVQLQRRYDLVPNLVETAKAYMAHEKETLTNVIAARNQAVAAVKSLERDVADVDAMQKLSLAESSLGGALGRLFAVSENYPELKADATMLQLMEELSSTENRVGFARQAFNDSVMEYNVGREQFPNFLLAGAFGFRAAEQLEISNVEAKQPVRVSFS